MSEPCQCGAEVHAFSFPKSAIRTDPCLDTTDGYVVVTGPTLAVPPGRYRVVDIRADDVLTVNYPEHDAP
jgi:hypothetical protein